MSRLILQVDYSDGCTFSFTETYPIKYTGDVEDLKLHVIEQIEKARARSDNSTEVHICNKSFNWYDLIELGDNEYEGKEYNLYRILTVDEWFGE